MCVECVECVWMCVSVGVCGVRVCVECGCVWSVGVCGVWSVCVWSVCVRVWGGAVIIIAHNYTAYVSYTSS